MLNKHTVRTCRGRQGVRLVANTMLRIREAGHCSDQEALTATTVFPFVYTYKGKS